MKVFKFGGASVKDADAVRNVKSVIANFSDKKELVVVVSAMGKTTNKLEALLEAYHANEDYLAIIDELRKFHFDIANELFLNKDAVIFKQLERLLFILEGKFKENIQDPDELYDQVVCFGELISTHLISAYLNQEEVPTQFIDARIYVQTSETWREGQVDFDWTEKMMKAELPPLLENHVLVTQGFIGGTISNRTTTLGREGSDFSAAIFAYCLDAESLTIWKDVPGVMNADPRRVSSAELYETISYKYAAEMTYYGASVIHPKTIRPLALKQIPLNVKSFINPADQGTTIGNFEMKSPKTAIIFKKDQSLLRFEEKDFLNVNKANLGVVFSELSRLNIKINLMRNSALSFTICADTNSRKFDKIQKVLENKFKVSITDGLELITIRNYKDDSLEAFPIETSEILLEQKTEKNYQIVRQL